MTVCVSSACFFLSPVHEDRSAQIALELHRSSYRDEMASLASLSFNQLRIGDSLAVRGGEKRVDAIAFLGVAAIVAPCELVQVAVDMLGADPMLDTEHLPLEVRPRAFQPVDMAEVVADVLSEAVVDGMVMEPAFQADMARELIAHNVGDGFDVFNDLALNRFGIETIHLHRAKLAAAFQHAEHGSLADAASPKMLTLPLMLVALFPSNKSFVDLNLASERLVEGRGCSGLAEPVRHEPCGFLCDTDIPGELRAGDSLLVRGDQPNGDIFEAAVSYLRRSSRL